MSPEFSATAALCVGEVGDALNARLRQLHSQLLETVPDVDRIACVLYDQQEDLLKTFVNSTRHGEAISGYEFRLADSESLSHLAGSRAVRVLDDIPAAVQANSLHSVWLLKEGYRSSLTVPLYDRNAFIGFLFYDSRKPAAFTPAVQRNLALFSTLMNMTISNELNLVRSIATSAQVAREFANLRDFETGSHLERMAHYSRLIARELAQSHGFSDLEGGLPSWQQAGLPVRKLKNAPLPLMRQVQIAAGSLVLLGLILGTFVAKPWILLSWFVGAGLVFAGVSGFCGMARLLAVMPWNRVNL